MNIMPEAIETVDRIGLGRAFTSAPMIVRYLDYRGQIAWYKESGQGSSVNRNEAWVFKAQECYDRREDDPPDARYEILPPGTPFGYLDDPAPMRTPAATPAVPGSLMEQKLVPIAIDMLKVAPKNPVARAYVQAAMRLPVPEELDTYEAIEKWFEEKYTPPANPEPASAAPAPATPQIRRAQLDIEIPFTERVYGTCDYSSTLCGNIFNRIDLDDILSLIDDNECDDLADLVNAVVRDTEAEGVQNVTDERDYCHDNHEVNNSDGAVPDPDNRELANMLRDFLSTHSPETLEALGEDVE